MTTTIQVTDAACAYIKKMIEKEHGVGFRLSVKKTGCSGFSYSPSILAQEKAGDVVMEIGEIKFFIDPAWLHVLEGLKIDYVEEEKAGLKQRRLVFVNPNESSRCGCGESFHLE